MADVFVQKSAWVIVVNPDAVQQESEPVVYYKDPRTMNTTTTKSPISAEWYDDKQSADKALQYICAKDSKMFGDAQTFRFIIGLQQEKL